MTTVDQLQALVASSFAELDLPSWPNPHPVMTEPREEEYSRVTDPERYRIVHARARAWASVLETELGARREVLAASTEGDGFARGVRLVPRQPDALPLLLLERDVPIAGQAPLAVLDVAVVRAGLFVDTEPDCGCDACDSGSRHLLEAVDATIRHIVVGPFVVLRGRNWHAEWHPDGGSSGSTGPRRGPDHRRLMGRCQGLAEGRSVRLPRGTEAHVGHTWLR